MSKTLNKVILLGYLGDDPKFKYSSNNQAKAAFSIATDLTWKDENGNIREKTGWHRIVAWRKMAEICNTYLKKGSKVYIEGRLQTRSWDDKDNKKNYMTEINLEELIMLSGKNGNNEAGTFKGKSDNENEDLTEKEDLPF
jgi:single-strand DNA-binding protein